MLQGVASLRRMLKGNLHVEFVRQDLTSYSGLELLRRYLRQLSLLSRLRAACEGTGGDYGGGRPPPGPHARRARSRPSAPSARRGAHSRESKISFIARQGGARALPRPPGGF